MIRLAFLLSLFLVMAPAAFSQSIPKELLAAPTRLELKNPTRQVKAGTPVTYTVILKNARGQQVPAARDMLLKIATPSGDKTTTLKGGQSSATFKWTAVKSGVGKMTVRSGKLHPASGLVLVAPSGGAAPIAHLALPHAGAIAHGAHPLEAQPHAGIGAAGAMVVHPGAHPAPHPAGAAGHGAPPPPAHVHAIAGAVLNAPAMAANLPHAGAQPAPPEGHHANKIHLYVDPLPVYGNAGDHGWKANVTVAALDSHNVLAPVAANVSVHFRTNLGRLTPQDIVLSPGEFGNFDHPVVLTEDRSGQGVVNAESMLGPANSVDVDYLQPLPFQLRFSHSPPVLTGAGSSDAKVQVWLLDESGTWTSSTQVVNVTLSGPGDHPVQVKIPAGSPSSDSIDWTSAPGAVTLQAVAVGLKPDTVRIIFPPFPWYFVWLAALGGLVGALLFSSGEPFRSRWWSHTWRSLVLGAGFGAIFYAFARFGAIALPSFSPVNIGKIPVVSGGGSFILGFLGGLYGRKLWKVGREKPDSPAPPSPAAGRA